VLEPDTDAVYSRRRPFDAPLHFHVDCDELLAHEAKVVTTPMVSCVLYVGNFRANRVPNDSDCAENTSAEPASSKSESKLQKAEYGGPTVVIDQTVIRFEMKVSSRSAAAPKPCL